MPVKMSGATIRSRGAVVSNRASPAVREAVMRRIAWLGFDLDPDANAKGGPLISRKGSRLPCYVIPTDEELMIARHTLRALRENVGVAEEKRT